jgi:integrase
MARTTGAWTVTSIHRLTDGGKKYGQKHTEPGGVGGLNIFVRGESRIYQFRYNWHTQPKALSIGSIRKVALADARAKARKYRSLLDDGVDPARATDTPELKPASTLAEDTSVFYERERRGWDEDHGRQWMRSMVLHALPVLGTRDTASITVQDVIDVLMPLWFDRHETGVRLHGRIRAVIGHAIKRARANRDMERFRFGNPADMALDLMPTLAPKEPVPHRALRWEDAPALYARLVALDDRRAHALRFLLMACTPRTAEVIQAQWSEIDLSDGPFGEVWHVPAGRMKGGRARDIPLSNPALDLLGAIRPADWTPSTYIFPAARRGRTVDGAFVPFAGHMQDDAMNGLLKELGIDSTVHGLRATFRSWVSDHAQSVQDHDAAELALDHTIGTKVHRAYDRADMLLQRRDLAERWAAYLMGR